VLVTGRKSKALITLDNACCASGLQRELHSMFSKWARHDGSSCPTAKIVNGTDPGQAELRPRIQREEGQRARGSGGWRRKSSRGKPIAWCVIGGLLDLQAMIFSLLPFRLRAKSGKDNFAPHCAGALTPSVDLK